MVRAFPAEVTAELPERDDESCMWTAMPLLAEASGELLHVALGNSLMQESVPVLQEMAERYHMVFFDPGSGMRVLGWTRLAFWPSRAGRLMEGAWGIRTDGLPRRRSFLRGDLRKMAAG